MKSVVKIVLFAFLFTWIIETDGIGDRPEKEKPQQKAKRAASPPHAKSKKKSTKLKKVKKPVKDQYIVVLNEEDTEEGERITPEDLIRDHKLRARGKILHSYDTILRAFAAKLSPQEAEALSNDPRVNFVEEDSYVEKKTTQNDAPWGIDRIDQQSLPLNHSYTYDANGTGVNVYVVDTGIRKSHSEFTGRTDAGYSVISDGRGSGDCDGHGTHVSGIIGGTTYGVAKGVRIYPVRVLNCEGTSTSSETIAGIDWVTRNHRKPAVVNLSLGIDGVSTALDNAVANSITAGLIFVIAAGNNGTDACSESPGRVPAAITVGATNQNDGRPSYSNYGNCVDIFAPGDNIVSAAHTADSATVSLSGTSMAAPHVTGAVAIFLQRNPNAGPSDVAQAIVNQSSKGKITSSGSGSPNALLFTTGLAAAPAPPTGYCTQSIQLFGNSGFEEMSTAWQTTQGVINTDSTYQPRGGRSKAWLNGYGTSSSDFVLQQVQIPAEACAASLDFWLWIDTTESENVVYDRLRVQILDSNGTLLKTLGAFSNVNQTSGYVRKNFDLLPYRGKTVKIRWLGREDEAYSTSFLVDDATLVVKK